MSSQHYSLIDGVPQSSINAVLVSPEGYVWLATFGGSARFDSQRFRTLSTGGVDELAAPRAMSLLRTSDGRVLVGAVDGGLGVVDGLAIRDANPTPELRAQTIHALVEGRDGTLWAATEAGVFRMSPSGDVRLFTTADGLATAQSYRLALDGDGTLWVVGFEGVSRISQEQASAVALSPADIPTYPPGSVAVDPAGVAWLGTARKGGMLRRADGNGAVLQGFLRPDELVVSLSFTRDGAAWIGTQTGRLLRFEHDRFVEVLFSKPALAVVRSVVDAAEEGYWVGTDTAGLFRLGRPVVERWTAKVPSQSVNAVTIDAAGTLYAARNCDGLRVISPQGGVHDIQNIGCVWSLLIDDDGSVLVGAALGLLRWRPGRSPQPIAAFDGQTVVALYRDRARRLWIGTTKHGLARLDGDRLTRWTPENSALASSTVQVFHDDGEAMWAGTSHGVVRIVGDTLAPAMPELGAAVVRAIVPAGDDALWIGTSGRGLWHVSSGRATNVTTREGLPEDTVSWIHPAEDGRLWLTGNRGIHRLTTADLTGGHVTTPLRSTTFALDFNEALECNGGFQPAGAVLPSGALLVPCLAGPVVAYPNRDVPNATPPPVLVTGARVGAGAIDVRDGVVVPADTRRFEFDLLGISFAAPRDLSFEYQLSPYDAGWVSTRSATVSFTGIPPGDYVFRARAINRDGVFSSTPATVAVRIEPSFRQTGWFAAMVVLGGVAVFAGSLRLYGMTQRRRALALERRVDAAMAELRILRGLLPICAWCKKIRSDDGTWTSVEHFVSTHSEATFTHGMCGDCSREFVQHGKVSLHGRPDES